MKSKLTVTSILMLAALSLTACATYEAAAAPTPDRAVASPKANTNGTDCTVPENKDIPDCAFALTGTEPLQPGQEPMDEMAAISAAITGFNAPVDARTQAEIIPFGDWPTSYGGSDFPAVDRNRPVWVVNVYAQPTHRFTGPEGGATPRPSDGYSVLLDSYSGHIMEFVTSPAPLG